MLVNENNFLFIQDYMDSLDDHIRHLPESLDIRYSYNFILNFYV